jgi:murein DD-endopeptidase MepM/ murein hydrolase activator NlpD
MKNLSLLVCCCCLPLKNLRLNSAYGYRVHPVTNQYKFHNGVDLHARQDTVFAISGGESTIGYDDYLGVYIKVNDANFSVTYGHLSMLFAGVQVKEGDPIAITGATGRVTGEHLHLSISYNGRPIDPIKFLYQTTIKPNNHE